MATNSKNRPTKTRNGFIVTNLQETSALLRPAYSGRVKGVWGPVGAAHVFPTQTAANACARDINRRNDQDYPWAQVVAASVRD